MFKCEQYLKNHQRRKHVEDVSAHNQLPLAKRPCLSPTAVFEEELNTNIKTEASLPVEESPFDPLELLKMQMSS
jgi:hypothetical protein